MSSLIWIQTVWHFDSDPERTFWKKLILNNICRWQKNDEKLPSMQRVKCQSIIRYITNKCYAYSVLTFHTLFHSHRLLALSPANIFFWKWFLHITFAVYIQKHSRPLLSWQQTVWNLIRLLLKEQSDLAPYCLEYRRSKYISSCMSRWWLPWMAERFIVSVRRPN